MSSKLRRSRSRFVMIGLMLASLVVASCVFEPRATNEPDPSQVGGTDLLPAQTPEVAISNLATIIWRLDSANYPDLFAEDFYFVPDAEDVDFMNNHYGPGIYLNWFKPVEVDVGSRLFDRLFGALVTFEEINVVERTDSTYVGYHEYTLEILPTRETRSVFKGIAHFYMRSDPADNLWYIYRWDDFRLQESSEDVSGTWGLLKGEVRATT